MRKRIEIEVDIDEYKLLRLLAKELHMEFALSDNTITHEEKNLHLELFRKGIKYEM